MKNRVWQAIVVIILLVVLSRTALQRDLQASAFEEKLTSLWKVGICQWWYYLRRAGSTVLLEIPRCGQQNMRQRK